jgi:hypothetical protein
VSVFKRLDRLQMNAHTNTRTRTHISHLLTTYLSPHFSGARRRWRHILICRYRLYIRMCTHTHSHMLCPNTIHHISFQRRSSATAAFGRSAAKLRMPFRDFVDLVDGGRYVFCFQNSCIY